VKFKNLTPEEACMLNILSEKEIGLRFDTLYMNYLARNTELENLKNDIGELIDELKRRL
jgi:HAMP domain-containing protein